MRPIGVLNRSNLEIPRQNLNLASKAIPLEIESLVKSKCICFQDAALGIAIVIA